MPALRCGMHFLCHASCCAIARRSRHTACPAAACLSADCGQRCRGEDPPRVRPHPCRLFEHSWQQHVAAGRQPGRCAAPFPSRGSTPPDCSPGHRHPWNLPLRPWTRTLCSSPRGPLSHGTSRRTPGQAAPLDVLPRPTPWPHAALWDMSLLATAPHPALWLTAALQAVVYAAVILVIVPACVSCLPLKPDS